jgi:CelD/BcsL family acetyltransferase involved in cellulose biosynthesis
VLDRSHRLRRDNDETPVVTGAQSSLTTAVLAGPQVLDLLGADLDTLHEVTSVPITGRRMWLAAWATCFPHYRPWAVTVRGQQGRLEAAAVLATRARGPLSEHVLMGHGPSDQSRLPARTAASATALADGIAEALCDLPSPWTLRAQQLPPDDLVVQRLLQALPASRVVPGQGSPTTRFGPDRSLRTYVSKNHHKQVRRMMNRLTRDHHPPELTAVRDPQAIAEVMGEVERVCRARDRQLGRRSKLDDEHAGAFFRRIITDAAGRDEVELVTLRVGSEVAAYVLSFLDRGSYRMWNCRFDPAWEHYGVGRIANDFALQRALADDDAIEFDWMKGEEPYKASFATDVIPAIDLLAWSSKLGRAVLDAPRRGKAVAKPHIEKSEIATRVVTRVRGA